MTVGTHAIRMPDSIRYRGEPPQHEVYRPDHRLDDIGQWLTDDVTFAKIKRLIRSADDGDIAETLQTFEEMELKSSRLRSVLNTRRMALTGLEWRVTSATESERFRGDKVLVDEVASFVDEALANLESWPQCMEHMATAIGPGLAMVEIVWQGTTVVELKPLPASRIQSDPQNDTVLRVVTGDNWQGIALDPAKWIVHCPAARTGFGWTRSLSHSLAYIYVMKLLALVDWQLFVEHFGIPFIWAQTDREVKGGEKTDLQNMLANWGTRGYGHFQKGVELTIVESSQRGISPHEAIARYCDSEFAVAALGQTLTTDTVQSTGTKAAAAVHDLVRRDLLNDDIKKEARTLARDLVKPLVYYNYPGRQPALPTVEHYIEDEVDRTMLADLFAKAQAAGMSIPRAWAYDQLGIPEPKSEEPILEPPKPPDVFEEGGL